MGNKKNSILEGLNSEQRKAVTCVEGPVLIVAGAGSGKTTVLTSRIAYILENGVAPEKILALTFTKKAASEMKERIADMVGKQKSWKLYMGTFHSVFVRLLREFSDKIGYPPNFTIYDTSDSTSLIKSCIRDLQLDDSIYKPREILSRISMAKNHLVLPKDYRRDSIAIQNDTAARKSRIVDIYELYCERCKKSGVMDFDDILVNMNILLRDSKEALESIAGRFDYIMVDEYQDTNYAQYVILRRLTIRHNNICVVGDDSQSIYGFRGAKIQNILNFKKDYPQTKTFRLEQNYRSTQTIVEAANSLIVRNTNRIPKQCFSAEGKGELIRLIQAYTEQEEASLVVSNIVSRINSDGAEYQDFAVLYRTNAQSRLIEEALRKRNIPYKIYSGNSFYERAEVKDMMAYFKLAVNLKDDESFKRVVNKPIRGIGSTSLAALIAAANNKGISLFEAAFADDLDSYGLKSAGISRIRIFCEMIQRLSFRAAKEDAYNVAVALAVESGLHMFYKSDTSIEGQSRLENVEELLNSVQNVVEEFTARSIEELQLEGLADESIEYSAKDFPPVTLGTYLEEISLLSAVDIDEEEDSMNKVALMTAHSAKGLEFPYVIVTGLEENLFPSGGYYATESEIEEERRLFYVAMTRAKKVLLLSYALARMKHGRTESNPPSRFLTEIDDKYILNPIRGEESSTNDSFAFGSKGGWNNYGRSSASRVEQRSIKTEDSRPLQVGLRTLRSETKSKTRTTVFRKPQTLPKRFSDDDFEPTPILEMKEGQRIEHNRFGYGVIEELTGDDVESRKARIAFDDFGEKILLLKYAKMRVVE